MKDMVDTIKFEKGKVIMTGMSFTFELTKSTYFTYKELEKVLGDDWKKFVYKHGKSESEESIKGYLLMSRNHPNIQKLIRLFHEPLVKFLAYQWNKLGIGRLELVAEDPSKPMIVLRLYFSPIALAYLEHEKAKEPVCQEFAGTMAGGAGFVYPGIEVVETKCIAKGDPYCEFVCKIPKKR